MGFLLLFEAGLLPSPLRKVSLPPQDEDAFLVAEASPPDEGENPGRHAAAGGTRR